MQVSDEAERSVLVKLKTECGYSNGEDDVELAVQVCIRYLYCCLMCIFGVWKTRGSAALVVGDR